MIKRSELNGFGSKTAEERFAGIVGSIKSEQVGNLNAMLDPEPVGCSEDAMESRIRFAGSDWERNQRGEIHGGAVSSMMDTAMGMSIMAASGRNVTTAELSVSFIRPFMSDAFQIDTEIIKLGRMLIRVRAIAFDEESGKLLATATGDFAFVD